MVENTTSKLGGHLFIIALPGLRYSPRPSKLRAQLDSVVDPKYIGTKISRKKLEEENTFGTVLVDSLEEVTSAFQSPSSEDSSSEDDEEEKGLSPGEEEIASEYEQPALRHDQGIEENPSHEKDLSSTVHQRRDEDRKKGKAVTKQLVRLAG
jgi:protein AATF/BFR2